MHDHESPSIAGTADGRRPSHVRHVVVFVLVLMALILYLDRFCVSFAERYIKQDLGLSEWQMSAFLSAFFWAYALAQVPAGWLGDRFGSRGMLVFYIVAWSLFTGLIGAAAGALMLIAMRLGCGAAQAGAYPLSGSILSRWVPFSRRALASALVALGGRAGAVVAPILTASLMVILVPASTSAELDEHSLLDPRAICVQLTKLPADSNKAASDTPERRIFSELPADAQDLVRITSETEAPLDQPRVARLTSALNGLLGRGDLFRTQEIERLPLEREAVSLLKRRERGESLSPTETARFNRLVLEAVFPSQLSKLYVKGWRPVLFLYAIAGLAVAALYWICVRDRPAQHPACNVAEQRLIAGSNTVDQTAGSADSPKAADENLFADMIASSSLWLSSISQFGTNLAWLFFVTYLPRYLMEVHHVPILERSWMVAIPPVAGIAGMFLGGQLTDVLTHRLGVRWGRALPMGATKFFAAAMYVACLAIDSPWLATLAFALGFFFVDLGVSSVWAYVQDVGGRNVAAVLGWGNMWGNIGAALAPFFYEAVLGSQPTVSDWNMMFLACAAVFVVSGLTGLGVDARVPISRK